MVLFAGETHTQHKLGGRGGGGVCIVVSSGGGGSWRMWKEQAQAHGAREDGSRSSLYRVS